MAVPQRRLADFFILIGCHGNVPWQIRKYSTDPSSARKALSYGEKIANIGLVHLEIFDEICRTMTSAGNAISIRMFSSETTGLIFSKFLHNVVALMSLFNLAQSWRYPIPFLNARATKVGSLPIFCTKSVAISKKRSRSIIYTQKAFIRCKDCENRSSGSRNNLSPRNH